MVQPSLGLPALLPVLKLYNPFGDTGTMESSVRSGQTRFLELEAAEAFRAMFSDDVTTPIESGSEEES